MYRVNIDFEFQLYQDRYDPFNQQYRKFCREFEFIFFFMEQDNRLLSSDRMYDEAYLKEVENLTGDFEICPFDLEANAWWGNLDNIPLEKKLNSKLTSFQIAKELELLPESSFMIKDDDSFSEIDSTLTGPCLVKNPFEMSGRGQKRSDYQAILDGSKKVVKFPNPYIIEPLHNISQDVGVRVDLDKDLIFYIEIMNSPGGQFIGGKKIEKPDWIDESTIRKVAMKYQSLGATKGIQMDCYRHDAGLRYLVEANHRKTMGDFIHSLTQRFGKGQLLSCDPSKEMKKGELLLSPPGNMKKWVYEVQ